MRGLHMQTWLTQLSQRRNAKPAMPPRLPTWDDFPGSNCPKQGNKVEGEGLLASYKLLPRPPCVPIDDVIPATQKTNAPFRGLRRPFPLFYPSLAFHSQWVWPLSNCVSSKHLPPAGIPGWLLPARRRAASAIRPVGPFVHPSNFAPAGRTPEKKGMQDLGHRQR